MDAGHQFAEPERFGHISGGPELEPEHNVEFGVDGTDHDDGHRRDVLEAPADFGPVDARQHQVEQDDVGPLLLEGLDTLPSVLGDPDVEPFTAEAQGQGLPIGLFVVDDEDGDGVARRNQGRRHQGRIVKR